MKRATYVMIAMLVISLALSVSFGAGTASAAGKKAEHEGPAVNMADVPETAKATLAQLPHRAVGDEGVALRNLMKFQQGDSEIAKIVTKCGRDFA